MHRLIQLCAWPSSVFRRAVGRALALTLAGTCTVHAANWNVARVGHHSLTPPAGVTVAEMSGVTYVGPAGDGHRFIAVEETKGELVRFDLTINASGAITAITNVTAIDINFTADFEGIAYTNATRNSVFISEESNPGVREVNLATGTSFQTLAVPPVFTAHKRGNLGFESFTRTQDAAVMWTANEQALTVDGPISTQAVGSVVRLLKFDVAGNTVTAGPQYAYQVEPIHGGAVLNTTSGLSDLAAMPDGTLLALERSLASPSPQFLNRIFEIDFNGATDVSVGALASGLDGQAYAKVAKQLLWSGAADGASGQNLEGLTLGPRLDSGAWVLVGVIDNGDGFFSGNNVVTFLATANPSADFDKDGRVDGADLLAWQRGSGKTVGAALADGDADRDGDVDATDLSVWKAASATAAAQSLPEPTAASLALLAAFGVQLLRRRTPLSGRQPQAFSRQPLQSG